MQVKLKSTGRDSYVVIVDGVRYGEYALYRDPHTGRMERIQDVAKKWKREISDHVATNGHVGSYQW